VVDASVENPSPTTAALAHRRSLLEQMEIVTQDQDEKLLHLKRLIEDKLADPINPSNKKVLVFSAFSDTAPSARFDAWTGATALGALRSGLALRYTMEEITSGTGFGGLAGAGSQWVNLAALAGGAFLLVRGIVRWQIPFAMLAGIAAPAAVMHWIDPGAYPGPLFECFAGAAMLGAFFIATDPVTAAASDRGRLVYGAGIGLLTWAIRHWGSYPDGVAFAVLTMNLAAPLIDRWTIPRIHGDGP